MNLKDLLGARRHAERMVKHYMAEIEPHPLPCGCPGKQLPGWQIALAEDCVREFRATIEAIDMAIKAMGADNEA